MGYLMVHFLSLIDTDAEFLDKAEMFSYIVSYFSVVYFLSYSLTP